MLFTSRTLTSAIQISTAGSSPIRISFHSALSSCPAWKKYRPSIHSSASFFLISAKPEFHLKKMKIRTQKGTGLISSCLKYTRNVETIFFQIYRNNSYYLKSQSVNAQDVEKIAVKHEKRRQYKP